MPVNEDDEQLEYDVYGKFKFENQPQDPGTRGRAWIGIEQLAMAENWDDKVEAFDERVEALKAAFL